MPLRRRNDEPSSKTPTPKGKDKDKDKAKVKAKEPKKRQARPDHFDDDDSSVDERGNIRGLIISSESESEDMSSSWRESDTSHDSPLFSKKTAHREAPPKRKSAAIAEKKIKKKLMKVVESSSEEEDEVVVKKKQRPQLVIEDAPIRKSKKHAVVESESEEEDESEEEEEEEESEDDDYDEEDEDEEEELSPRRGGAIELLISDFGGGSGEYRPQKPKKYKMSKEPENVRRFVKLVQTAVDPDEEDIDRDIGYFKGLSPTAQEKLLTKLHTKIEPAEPTVPLKFQIMSKDVPAEIERVALAKYNALMNIDPSSTEYYKASQWLHGYTQLPLGIYKDLPVKIEDGTTKCQEFMSSVRANMESAIYGHEEAKLQIMQFVSSWIANPQAAGNVLSIHGPPGVGKTTLIKDGVAKALGRPFHFITLGGATDASFLDGHSYTYEGSTWGRIVDVLTKSKCMNPVIYFDELDKVSETPKGEEINNLLIHLTDGSQNDRFQDKYFTGIDLNLSRCLFIFSHNNHERVNPILRDRMYNIQVEGFNLKEKLVIAEQYLVSQALREVNLFEKIGINKDIITHIIENFTGEEKGVRELKRCIQTVISKVNLLRFYNDSAKVPFAIKDFALPFTLKRDHIDLFLKKKQPLNDSIAHLYV